MQYATAYPFRLPECTMACVYCYKTFEDSSQFRKHMEDEHRNFPLWTAFEHVPEGYIKVDCTELHCRICLELFEKLEQVAEHLLKVHSKTSLNLNYDLGMQPFKLCKGKWMCALCNDKFLTLRTLSRHTQTHFAKYTCESCGKSYSTVSTLQAHIKNSHIGDKRLCRKCKRTFKTLEERRRHLSESQKCWAHLCRVCGERFITWNMRLKHQSKVHGAQKRTYSCPECKSIFTNRTKYRGHFKSNHVEINNK